VKLALKRPIQVGETSAPITELTFREEVVAGDLRGIKQSSLADPLVDDVLKIAGRLTGQPDAVMNRLSPEDLGEVMGIVHGFFKAGPETGTTP
jgi:hypothetical protein